MTIDNGEKICVFRHKSKSRAYHSYVVLKTANHYYSVERFTEYASIQRFFSNEMLLLITMLTNAKATETINETE